MISYIETPGRVEDILQNIMEYTSKAESTRKRNEVISRLKSCIATASIRSCQNVMKQTSAYVIMRGILVSRFGSGNGRKGKKTANSFIHSLNHQASLIVVIDIYHEIRIGLRL